MICPNKKHKKPVNLKTVRTLANGRSVRREKVCPKCDERFWTYEMYEVDKVRVEADFNHEMRDMQDMISELENELSEYRDFFGQFKSIVMKGDSED
jgi:transcriptional regulator NrdR family protein